MRMKEKEQQEIKRTQNSSFISLHLRLNGFVSFSHILYVCSLSTLTPFNQIYSKLKELLFLFMTFLIVYELVPARKPLTQAK